LSKLKTIYFMKKLILILFLGVFMVTLTQAQKARTAHVVYDEIISLMAKDKTGNITYTEATPEILELCYELYALKIVEMGEIEMQMAELPESGPSAELTELEELYASYGFLAFNWWHACKGSESYPWCLVGEGDFGAGCGYIKQVGLPCIAIPLGGWDDHCPNGPHCAGLFMTDC
jgi:hypothetical protein